MTTEKLPTLYTLKEAAGYLTISTQSLRIMAIRDKISHVKILNRIRFTHEQLENFINQGGNQCQKETQGQKFNGELIGNITKSSGITADYEPAKEQATHSMKRIESLRLQSKNRNNQKETTHQKT